MKRLESPMDYARGTVTYDIGDGRYATFDARAVERYGLAELLKEYGVEMPTERVPVFQYGRRIGTMPADFDPYFGRSVSFIYDLRPGDFTRTSDGWVVGRTMGASDVDCVAGFIRDDGQGALK
jgi:hypothetical protein